MKAYVIPNIVMATVCFTIALNEILTISRRSFKRIDAAFLLMCLGGCLYNIFCAGEYNVAVPVQSIPYLRAESIALNLAGMALFWYVLEDTRIVHRPFLVFYLVWSTFGILMEIVNPGSFLWIADSPDITGVTLPFGIRIVYNDVEQGMLQDVLDYAGVCLLIYLLFLSIRKMRADPRKESGWLVAVLAVLLLGYLNDAAVDAKVYSFIYTTEYGWLALILLVAVRRRNERRGLEAAKQELLKSEVRFRQLFDSANVGIFQSTLAGGVVAVNPEFARMLGYESPKDFVANVHDAATLFADPKRREEIVSLMKTHPEVDAFENRYVRKDGSTFIGRLKAKKIADPDENTQIVLGFVEDATEQYEAREKLLQFSSELERQVAKRTEELTDANLRLSSAMQEIQRAQDELIRSEKLAAVGKLGAGIAHEVNTPLGAILSANRTVMDFIDTGVSQTVLFLLRLGPEQRTLYFQVVELADSDEGASRNETNSQIRRKLESQLTTQGIDKDSEIVNLLLDLNIEDLPGKLPSLFRDPRCAEILSRALEQISAKRMSEIVGVAGERAANVVSALRQHLGPSDPSQVGIVEVEKDLELALTLLHSRIKNGISVERQYGGVVAQGSSHDLTQVWINLMNNSIQAMEYAGRLIVATESEQGSCIVRIIDSGPGIDDSIRDRIFEPFFSTKKTGEGMGLGLDICRKIVERNGGKIEFESRPGRTCFTVKLQTPLKR